MRIYFSPFLIFLNAINISDILLCHESDAHREYADIYFSRYFQTLICILYWKMTFSMITKRRYFGRMIQIASFTYLRGLGSQARKIVGTGYGNSYRRVSGPARLEARTVPLRAKISHCSPPAGIYDVKNLVSSTEILADR